MDERRRLLEAVIAIGSGLELEAMLRRVVEAAVELVEANRGALGVIGEDRRLAQFIPVGLTAEEIRCWPPDGHPVIGGRLRVPVRTRDQVFGNLYLSGKRTGGEFTAEDEALLIALGGAAGVAIDNARLYDEARRQQRLLRASADVATQLLSGESPEKVLETVTRQVLELSGADLVTLEIPDEDAQSLTVTSAEGLGAARIAALVIPLRGSLAARVIDSGEPLFVTDLAAERRAPLALREALSHIGPAAVFPVGAPGTVRGVLIVGRAAGGPSFPPSVTALVAAFAAQAGVALELAARRDDAERLLVYQDRDRIARDLHDLVIQRLYATGMSLEGTMPLATRPELADRIANAVDAMDDTIKDIRASIFALQAREPVSEPALRADILALVDEMTQVLGFAPTLRLGGGLNARIASALGDHALAVLREALSNVARHADATRTDITVATIAGDLSIIVSDNGRGIAAADRRSGLANMADRARALDGELSVQAGATGGTELIWRVPVSTSEPLRPDPSGRYPLS